jgi:hypothetical protein
MPMESLRSLPSQGPRKKALGKLSKPGAGPRSKIDDKIKKRMSTRYADISSPTQLTVPPMPNLNMVPAGQNSADYVVPEADEDKSVVRDEAKVVVDDRKLLSAEDFDPNACECEIQYSFGSYIATNVVLKLKLANSTEAELKSLRSSLQNAIDDTASDLQRSVFKKYCFQFNLRKEE